MNADKRKVMDLEGEEELICVVSVNGRELRLSSLNT